MKRKIIIILTIILGVIGYLVYAVFYEKDPFAIQLVVVFTILLVVSMVSYFFPNSKLAKFLKKLAEWMMEGF